MDRFKMSELLRDIITEEHPDCIDDISDTFSIRRLKRKLDEQQCISFAEILNSKSLRDLKRRVKEIKEENERLINIIDRGESEIRAQFYKQMVKIKAKKPQ